MQKKKANGDTKAIAILLAFAFSQMPQ